MMATGKRGREDWEDNSQGIARQDAPARHRTASGTIRPLRHITPPAQPVEPSYRHTPIPHAPSEDVANLDTAQLPPRPISSDMMPARFYVDETVMLGQIKREIEKIERMNQRLRRPYEMGSTDGIYTDILESGCVTYIAEAAQLLLKARKYKQAYVDRHAFDDPEGA